MVRGRDQRGAGAGGSAPEGSVTRFSRVRLQARASRDANARAFEPDIELSRQRLGDVELSRRLGTQAVIDPVSEQRKAELLAKASERVEQRL